MYVKTILDMIAAKYGYTIHASRDESVVRYVLDGYTIRVTFGESEGYSYGRPQSAFMLELEGYKQDEDSPWVFEWRKLGGYSENTAVYGATREQAILGWIIDQMGSHGEYVANRKHSAALRAAS
jgi:hypothetical protein